MPPASPVTIPAEADCDQLLTQPAAIASIRACATATGPQGTVTGTDEGYAHTEVWDVFERVGASAVVMLTYVGNSQATPGFVFHGVATAGDGEEDLLAVEHTPGVLPVAAVDVIDLSGAVLAHIRLGPDGVVGPAPGGDGILTWSAGPSADEATMTTIRYESGEWRQVSAVRVPVAAVPRFADDDGYGGGLP